MEIPFLLIAEKGLILQSQSKFYIPLDFEFWNLDFRMSGM